ncbi:MAG: uracil-DNA glycosylase [Paludibacteraceae bacterium]|nr:uracil-DNA glycosylase [Paludibacteraceae bacterium]MBQ2591059.1 uracil-DNA glycosylase [Paludibacteraceae bacterium]
MDVKIENSWKEALKNEFEKPYFASLCDFVRQEYKTSTIYPPASLIFNAFNLCPMDKIKVVIIGQDPYHEPGQAHGLCFSVNDGVKFPPSLQNIYKEIASEYNQPMPQSGNLTRWAEQGVLLLNATLTVRAHLAASHQGKGWETFTDNVIKEVNDRCQNVVFLLWGSYAQKKEAYIDKSKHCVLKAAHPSPLSAYRGFFGCNHFILANNYLRKCGKEEIVW